MKSTTYHTRFSCIRHNECKSSLRITKSATPCNVKKKKNFDNQVGPDSRSAQNKQCWLNHMMHMMCTKGSLYIVGAQQCLWYLLKINRNVRHLWSDTRKLCTVVHDHWGGRSACAKAQRETRMFVVCWAAQFSLSIWAFRDGRDPS